MSLLGAGSRRQPRPSKEPTATVAYTSVKCARTGQQVIAPHPIKAPPQACRRTEATLSQISLALPSRIGHSRRQNYASLRRRTVRRLRPILAALVAVVYQFGRSATTPECNQQSVCNHLGLHRIAHRPANDATREQVHDRRDEQPAFGRPEWSKRPGVVELSPGLSSPNRTCTSQRIRLSVQALLIAKATSG